MRDTVSALGLPAPLGLPQLTSKKLAFVDDDLSPRLKNVFHALVLNGRRKDFKPVIWANVPVATNVKQCWFLGAHSDVGGGNEDVGLANITLLWMIAQLRIYTRLTISKEYPKGFFTLADLSNAQVE